MKCSPKDLVQLQNALWNILASQPILVEERYIDSFVIDICISKFPDKAREAGKGFTVFFPSEFYDWMRSNDKEFQKR